MPSKAPVRISICRRVGHRRRTRGPRRDCIGPDKAMAPATSSSADDLEQWIRRVIQRAGPPPRQVGLAEVAKRVYMQPSNLVLLGVAAVLGASTVGVAFAPGSPVQRLAIQSILVALAAVFLFAPLVRSLKIRGAMRDGQLRKAIVETVAYLPPRATRETIDAYNHGQASGLLRLRGTPPTELSFRTDARWAPELIPGAAIDVLLDQSGTELILLVGPSNDGRMELLR